jgi:hypothetical protein
MYYQFDPVALLLRDYSKGIKENVHKDLIVGLFSELLLCNF